MPSFQYKGRDGGGAMVTGVVEAADSAAAADQLFGAGVTPIDIQPARAAAGRGILLSSARAKCRARPAELILFSRQMHTLLKAGVPMLHALSGLQEAATNHAFAQVLQDLRVSLAAGRGLGAAMSRHPVVFSTFYVSLVQVGEATGTLEQTFLRLAHYLEFEKYMRDQVKSALRYPMFVVIAMAVAIGVINVFVIPAFARVYAGYHAQLPAVTTGLIAFSGFTVRFWPLLLGGGAAAAAAFRAWTRTPAGRLTWDRIRLRLPVAGPVVLKAALARFCRGFAVAIGSGTPVVQGMGMVARIVDNAWIGARIAGMCEGVQRGESILRAAREASVFTPVVLQMIAVGEESGALDQMMLEMAQMYEGEVEYDVRTLGEKIEPVLIVCLGALVLVLALGVLLPMWDMARVATGKH